MRKNRLIVLAALLLAFFCLSLFAGCAPEAAPDNDVPDEEITEEEPEDEVSDEVITVGVITALSGVIAADGQGLLAVSRLWADQVNAEGGILGREVVLKVEDSASDPTTANEKARIMVSEGVDVVIGPILTAERTATAPVVTEAGIPFLYSTFYEGGAYDDLMFILAEVPEQQTEKFIPWLAENRGKRFYFVGSDYEYPILTNERAKEYLEASGGEVVGEEYVVLGTTDFSSVISRIEAAQPDVVFNNTVGTDAIAFSNQFYEYGLLDRITFASTTHMETYIDGIGPEASEGILVSFGYFESIDTPENRQFVEDYRQYESNVRITTITQGAYEILRLWAEAVERAGTTEGQAVKGEMEGLTIDTLRGSVTMRAHDHHAAMPIYIAEVKDGDFVILEDLGVLEPGEDQREAR